MNPEALVGHLSNAPAVAVAWVGAHPGWVGGGITVAVCLCLLVEVLRTRATRSSLARRTAYELIPSTAFDPNAETVARFAGRVAEAQISGVPRLTRPKGAAVRIRFRGTAGRFAMQLEGPPGTTEALRYQAYSDCEMRPLDPDSVGTRPKPIRFDSPSAGRPRDTAADTP